MVEDDLKTLFYYFIASGVIGSVLGAVCNFLSGPNKIRFDAALAIGFLVGSAMGTLIGCFQNMMFD